MDVNKLSQTYKGKKVFLTGHTGFKGSWLLQWLHLLGAEVKGFALEPQNKDDLFNLIDGDSLCTSVIADIGSKKAVSDAMLSFQPDFVFHLAAQPLVRLSYEIPSETFLVNAIGTAHILDALIQLEKPCTAILITTDKVYENKEWIYPYRETDPLGGLDPYSASKAAAELIIHSYVHSFFHPDKYPLHRKAIASTRAGNVIGGGDWAKDRILPDIVRSLMAGKPLQMRNPNAVRPWQHVLDPLGGYLLLGAAMAEQPRQLGGAWNFGPLPADNKRVEDLVQTALAVWGSGTYEKDVQTHHPHEAGLLMLDISKAAHLLEWTPKYNSTTAIRKTIEWYKAFAAKETDIQALTRLQIKEYMIDATPETTIGVKAEAASTAQSYSSV